MRLLSKGIVYGFALLALALLSAWVGAFVVRNGHLVAVYVPEPRLSMEAPLQTVIWDAQMSWFVLGLVGLGGLVSVVLLVVPLLLRGSYARRRCQRLIKALEEELSELRQLQLVEPMPLSDLSDEDRERPSHGVQTRDEPDDSQLALLDLGDVLERRR